MGEGTFGASERENKTRNQTVQTHGAAHCIEEKQEQGAEGEASGATGRRIPAGTTGDVNQWVIRAAVPQEGESRPVRRSTQFERRTEGERERSEASYQGKVDPRSMEIPRSRIIYSSTLDENFRS